MKTLLKLISYKNEGRSAPFNPLTCFLRGTEFTSTGHLAGSETEFLILHEGN